MKASSEISFFCGWFLLGRRPFKRSYRQCWPLNVNTFLAGAWPAVRDTLLPQHDREECSYRLSRGKRTSYKPTGELTTLKGTQKKNHYFQTLILLLGFILKFKDPEIHHLFFELLRGLKKMSFHPKTMLPWPAFTAVLRFNFTAKDICRITLQGSVLKIKEGSMNYLFPLTSKSGDAHRPWCSHSAHVSLCAKSEIGQ